MRLCYLQISEPMDATQSRKTTFQVLFIFFACVCIVFSSIFEMLKEGFLIWWNQLTVILSMQESEKG